MTKRNMLITSIAVAGIALGVFGAGASYAQSNTNTPSNLVQMIAEKFNLNQADVQTVFDDHRNQMRQMHQANLEDRLNTLVSDGKLTEDQKNKLIEKMAEHQNDREEHQNLSFEERQAERKEHREEFQTWLKDNGIDENILNFGMGRGGPMGHEGKGFRMMDYDGDE